MGFCNRANWLEIPPALPLERYIYFLYEGLEFYSTVWIGLVWHVIILAFSVIQYELLQYHARTQQTQRGLVTEYERYVFAAKLVFL